MSGLLLRMVLSVLLLLLLLLVVVVLVLFTAIEFSPSSPYTSNK